MSIQSTRDGAGDLFWLMSSFGITTVFDAGMFSFQDVGLQALGELEREGRLPLRVVASHSAAYQLNLERELGSIEVGKRADIIVLTQNLFELDTVDIHNARVDLTMLNGKVVYERGWRALVAEWMLGM